MNSHHPIDIIQILLPIIPSILSFCDVIFKKSKEPQKLKVGYITLCIIYGFAFFPSNTYAGYLIGIFMCCVSYLNENFSQKGKPTSWFFPWLFFFNVSSFRGINLFEDICMVIYVFPVATIYFLGILDKKIDKELLVSREKLCVLISAIIFIIIKVVFLFFTDT